MAEKRIIEFNTATPTNNDYFLMDNQQDGCRKVALDGLFGSGKLTVNGASGSQIEVSSGNTISSSATSVVVGSSNYVSGGESVVVGTDNSASGRCLVVGNNLTASGDNLLVLGANNVERTDDIIVVGDGADSSSLSNLFRLTNDGKIYLHGSGTIIIDNDLIFGTHRYLSEELDKYKYVTIQNTLIETTDWALEGTPTYADYPYVADISVTNIVTTSGIEYTADIIPSERMISDGLLYSVVTTTSTAIKIYASDVPQVNYTIPLITLKALRGGTL